MNIQDALDLSLNEEAFRIIGKMNVCPNFSTPLVILKAPTP